MLKKDNQMCVAFTFGEMGLQNETGRAGVGGQISFSLPLQKGGGEANNIFTYRFSHSFHKILKNLPFLKECFNSSGDGAVWWELRAALWDEESSARVGPPGPVPDL